MKTGITSLSLSLLIAASAVQTKAQEAWSGGNGSDVVLITPEGDVLNFIPDATDIVVRVDGRGRRVLIDRYGNVVATEMPAQTVYGRQTHRTRQLPGVETFGRNSRNAALVENRDYFPAPPPPVDRQDITGTIPLGDNRLDVERRELPSDGIGDNGGLDGSDLASLESQPTPQEQRQPDPVITLDGKKSRLEITALQVFLDREGASPGAIDGKMGSNVSKAILAYEQMSGETLDPNNTDDILSRLSLTGGMPIMNYEITSADAAGPYVASIPEDYSQKASMPAMGYTSVSEALAERFHMDESYLKALNPGVDFTIPGTIIKVVNPGTPKKGTVARIVADKFRKQVRAYDIDGALIAAYPASIGSTDTPSPSGIHTVERIAFNPNYTYNPKINFQQGSNTKILTIPPGPNGPVGTVWMALDKPTYGIHGTPEPSKIGRTQSHGCIRLTNWDATELAKMVRPGVTVEFVD